MSQQKSKAMPPLIVTDLLLNGKIYLGRYQVQAAAVCLEFIRRLISMYIKESRGLFPGAYWEEGELSKDAAEDAQEALAILRDFEMRRSYADILEVIV